MWECTPSGLHAWPCPTPFSCQTFLYHFICFHGYYICYHLPHMCALLGSVYAGFLVPPHTQIMHCKYLLKAEGRWLNQGTLFSIEHCFCYFSTVLLSPAQGHVLRARWLGPQALWMAKWKRTIEQWSILDSSILNSNPTHLLYRDKVKNSSVALKQTSALGKVKIKALWFFSLCNKNKSLF